MTWERETVLIFGPEGIRVKTWRSQNGYVLRVYVAGSEKPLHWLHHVLPGSGRREIKAGKALAELVYDPGVQTYHIAGHSLGGSVAICANRFIRQMAAEYDFLNAPHAILGRTLGSKRAPRGFTSNFYHYRNRGDFVPFLPPWRKKLNCIVTGKWQPVWKAHTNYSSLTW